MSKETFLCTYCNAPMHITAEPGKNQEITCEHCQQKNMLNISQTPYDELMFYSVNEPYAYVSIVKQLDTLKREYRVLEPQLKDDEKKVLSFLQQQLLEQMDIHIEDVSEGAEEYLATRVEKIIQNYNISLDPILLQKLLYYIKRRFIGYERIDALLRDPRIEDISCDGAQTSMFVYHRDFGSLETNIIFSNEDELSKFVVHLAQKCGKHISVADPMLDATMPDGSRIQMTLSTQVTTKGSTFTIRKFRADPITPIDLIEYNTIPPKIIAYLWLIVEHGYNALISGGTASGKTSVLNAISLFIPREAKIVSIEETREINLPHPNWIPGVTRLGFGEVVNDRLVGEIDLFDLMKAALRQRPEYILVGEIRGREAYVLFQAMATGHTTYSTVHADTTTALIHRLEGKPINVPRTMIQSLDLILLEANVKMGEKQVRRCKQIVEVLSVDVDTKEILTNTVFKWDPKTDTFEYLGKSYLLEQIRTLLDLSKDEMLEELERREDILKWMHKYTIREFKDVAQLVASYAEKPERILEQISQPPSDKPESLLNETSDMTSLLITQEISGKQQLAKQIASDGKKKKFSEFFKLKKEKKHEEKEK